MELINTYCTASPPLNHTKELKALNKFSAYILIN